MLQTNSVKEYQRKFEILFKKVHEVSEEFHISASGLRDNLRTIITMFKSLTLSTAFGLAQLQE